MSIGMIAAIQKGLLMSVILLPISALGQSDIKTHLYHATIPEFQARISGPLFNVYQGINDPTTKQATTLLVNDDDRAVAGYVVKWSFITDGVTHSIFQPFSDERQIDNPEAPTSGFGLKAHENRLLSPSYNIHSSEASDLHILRRINGNNSRMASSVSPHTTVVPTASLDAVIYSDSTIMGPDESEYSKRFVAERNAQHDAGVSVLLARSKGESEDQILQRLQRAIAEGEMASTSTAPDHYYKEARGRWAQIMLQVQQHLGQDGMLRNATQAARLKAIHLTKKE